MTDLHHEKKDFAIVQVALTYMVVIVASCPIDKLFHLIAMAAACLAVYMS